MVSNEYVPERGDIVRLNFNPQTGHEQKGKRPAIVISPKTYNEKVNLGLFCPITSKEKKYPFEVKIKDEKIDGVVLSDQMSLPAASGVSCKRCLIDEARSVRKLFNCGVYYHFIVSVTESNRRKRRGIKPHCE